jgi:protein-disulfide isomerase
MDEQKNIFIIPGAIVLAGAIIGAAVIYSVKTPAANNQPATAALAAVPQLSQNDFVLGEQNAPVTVVTYSDYQCPFCEKFFKETESVLRDKYIKSGKVKFIYRNFAFLGDESKWAANAAMCAGEQGKFWQYHDYLFNNQNGENQGAFSKDNLKKFALSLGLDKTKFNSCVDSDKYASVIAQETKSGGEAGVSGTPASFVNGTLYPGALPVGTFTQIIENELNKVK